MMLARIYIAAILVIIGICQAKTSGSDFPRVQKVQNLTLDSNESLDLEDTEDTKPLLDILKEKEPTDDLPILPPIILLDFGNDTENENVTSEEKSKRTVNSGIGYGLGQNSLQSGGYNYYFPAGKTGTTVSIEESISPFLPKTIIEKVQPSNLRTSTSKLYGSHQYFNSMPLTQSHGNSNYQYLNPEVSSNLQFGLRTKLSYQNFLSTPKPTNSPYGIQNFGYRSGIVSTTEVPSPLGFSSTEKSRFVTSSPSSYTSSRGNVFDYSTSNSYSRQPTRINAQTYPGHRSSIQSSTNYQAYELPTQSAESSTVKPVHYNSHYSRTPPRLPNVPRYTVENGIRYENKIFWKYPDGRVSDVPPATYVETSDYSPASIPQATKSENLLSIYETNSKGAGIYSQKPLQFPRIHESNEQQPSPFISSDSLSSSLPQQQVFRLGYQNLVTQKQSTNTAQQGKPVDDVATSYSFSALSSPSVSAGSKTSTGNHVNYEPSYSRRHMIPKYMVNSPNPEYTETYTTEPTVNYTTPMTNLFTPSAGVDLKKQNAGNKDLNSYSNLQYSDLLNYNPSISQYIRNPSSILNVHPTFVQTGNSLIPVIILRVDSASPVQPKVTPNINLKALLQQYLLQYASGIQELARPNSYDLGTEDEKGTNSVANKSPLLDLIRLTQNDAREPPTYPPNSYNGKSSYETSDLDGGKNFGSKYSDNSSVRQKVKNVQIVDDPRYTSYKAKN